MEVCLVCENQIFEGHYCSQTCRLADLDRAGSSPASPLTPVTFASPIASWASSHLGGGTGFYLPPALNFDTYKISTGNKTPLATSPRGAAQAPQPYQHSPQGTPLQASTPHRILSPSSSRSSLTSSALTGISSQTSDGLSEQAKNELRDYVNAFDHTREWRRYSNPPCLKHGNGGFGSIEFSQSYPEDHN